MSKSSPPPRYDSFDEFYVYAVAPLKRENPAYFRLDGRGTGASRQPFAYFNHRGKWWKVDEDTWIEKLDIAYALLLKNEDPFLI